MTDFLLLTKKEVREAKEDGTGCRDFLCYGALRCPYTVEGERDPICELCKVLTEFATKEEEK